MKWFTIIVLLFAVAFAEEGDDEELALAETCDEELCKLPDCRCSSTSIPGGLLARDIPQVSKNYHNNLVILTYLNDVMHKKGHKISNKYLKELVRLICYANI